MSYRRGAELKLAEIEAEKQAEIDAALAEKRERISEVLSKLEELENSTLYKALPENGLVRKTLETIVKLLKAAEE